MNNFPNYGQPPQQDKLRQQLRAMIEGRLPQQPQMPTAEQQFSHMQPTFRRALAQGAQGFADGFRTAGDYDEPFRKGMTQLGEAMAYRADLKNQFPAAPDGTRGWATTISGMFKPRSGGGLY